MSGLTAVLSKPFAVWTAVIVFAAGLIACSPAQEQADTGLKITDAYFRQPLLGSQVTAAYMKVSNHYDTEVVLEQFSAQGVGRVELHNHLYEDGMMKMREVERAVIPAGEELLFEPGGYHLMLFDVSQAASAQSALDFEVRTSAGEQITFRAESRSVNSLDE